MAFAHPAVERGLTAAIGYCSGGQAVIEQIRCTMHAIVSFHGLLYSKPLKLNKKGHVDFGAVHISGKEHADTFVCEFCWCVHKQN